MSNAFENMIKLYDIVSVRDFGPKGDTKPLYLGAYALWVDSAGALRIKNGATPTAL